MMLRCFSRSLSRTPKPYKAHSKQDKQITKSSSYSAQKSKHAKQRVNTPQSTLETSLTNTFNDVSRSIIYRKRIRSSKYVSSYPFIQSFGVSAEEFKDLQLKYNDDGAVKSVEIDELYSALMGSVMTAPDCDNRLGNEYVKALPGRLSNHYSIPTLSNTNATSISLTSNI